MLKSLISFGVYGYFIGKKRKNRILNRLQQNKLIQGIINKNIFYKENEIRDLKALISFYKKNIKNTCTYLALIKRLANLVYEQKLQSITPLPVHYEPDNSFISLKTIIGVKYEKIIGVYVIHNRENNKYYVGQSKDIYKRLKQHFVGTVPKNVIFAKDYYFSKSENKSDLFEVKIIPCGTKDELDKTEKNLIELYDSYNLGYNGTNGNT
ncbi:MAG: GIY-YIG nuclease family protein [Clostridia bacterium]|nr:GIY-YIG nuclease family protein [Clostridia bacterium]